MYTTDLLRERERELRQAGRSSGDGRNGLRLRRVRAFAARIHPGR